MNSPSLEALLPDELLSDAVREDTLSSQESVLDRRLKIGIVSATMSQQRERESRRGCRLQSVRAAVAAEYVCQLSRRCWS